MVEEVMCVCGKPLHYTNGQLKKFVEDQIKRLGPTIKVIITGKGAWLIPRNFIALHGIKGQTIEKDAEKYGFEKVEP